ncbi:MAG: hypothetical protein IPP49_02500 [Saprospiraceae bacterium]|nr:hypothetical protein [Saprospiraceae bacterium]
MDGGTINRNSEGSYTVNVNSPGKATVKVSAPGMNGSKEFRVKRIPDPTPLLGGKEKGGSIGNGTFKAHGALLPMLLDFDFDAKCNLAGFTLVRVAKRQDPGSICQSGSFYSGRCKKPSE